MIKNEQGGAVAATFTILGGIIAVVVVLPLIGAALGIINLPFLRLQKKVELNQGVINKSFSTEYCLSNYEWFKDTYQKIEQADTQISNAKQQLDEFTSSVPDRSKWTFEDKQLYSSLTTQVTGIKNYKADLVGQYNSRTQQLNRVACKELPLFVQP